MKVSLPDLRAHLLYYGALSRPDNENVSPFLLIGLRGQSEAIHTRADKPLFLQYDNEKNQWKPTEHSPLKLTFKPTEKTLEISQEISLPNGQSFKEPHHLALFTLPLMTLPPMKQAEALSFDGMVIDGRFWEAQNAMWWGKDALYDSLSTDIKKSQAQRILLNDLEGTLYTLWVQEGDGFIYKNGRWTEVEFGNESRKKTLLYVQAISDRTIEFEIWGPNGTSRVALPLSKKEPPSNAESALTINLIGARSRNTWIATINGQRTLLRTDDWFLLKEGVIEKLETRNSLESYIQGHTEGTLLAFSGIERIGNEQKLTGISIDPTRTKITPIAVSLFHSWDSKEDPSLKTNKTAGNGHHHEDEDDDDIDDEDLEDIEEDSLYEDE